MTVPLNFFIMGSYERSQLSVSKEKSLFPAFSVLFLAQIVPGPAGLPPGCTYPYAWVLLGEVTSVLFAAGFILSYAYLLCLIHCIDTIFYHFMLSIMHQIIWSVYFYSNVDGGLWFYTHVDTVKSPLWTTSLSESSHSLSNSSNSLEVLRKVNKEKKKTYLI